jgi:hypothetical protein
VFRERREAWAFGNDDAHQHTEVGADELPVNGLEDQREEIPRRSRKGINKTCDAVEHGSNAGLNRSQEESLLIGKVEVDRALRDAGPAGYILQPRRSKPMMGELLQSRFDQLRGASLLPAAPRCTLPMTVLSCINAPPEN